MALHPSLLTSEALAETGPDAALIAACNRFAACEIRRYGADWSDEDDEAAHEEHRAAFDAMMALQATTIEGTRARARAAALYLYHDESGGWDTQLTETVLHELLGLPAPEAVKDVSPGLSEADRAALAVEDPWQAEIAAKPFRETFPLWERSPGTLDEWLTAARKEFFMLGFCQVMQRRDMATMEKAWREAPAECEEVMLAFIGLHRRYAKMANALHGEAMRTGLAKMRTEASDTITGGQLLRIAMLDGHAMGAAA